MDTWTGPYILQLGAKLPRSFGKGGQSQRQEEHAHTQSLHLVCQGEQGPAYRPGSPGTLRAGLQFGRGL